MLQVAVPKYPVIISGPRRWIFMAASVLLLLLAPQSASGQLLDITPTGETFGTLGSMTNGRGIYITANDNFGIDSIGWLGNINVATEYAMQIHEGIGETNGEGPLLRSQLIDLPLTPNGFTDVPLSSIFAFTSGLDYIITLRRSDGVSGWSTTFDFLTFGSGPEESNLGVLTIKAGTFNQGSPSSGIAHYRLNVVEAVPEPSIAVLFAAGMIGLTFTRRRSNNVRS